MTPKSTCDQMVLGDWEKGVCPGDPEEPTCPNGYQRLGEGARHGDSRELI